MNLSRLNRRRIAVLRANRRGWCSLWLFVGLIAITLPAEFIANDRPLLISSDRGWSVPVLATYTETDFAGEFETEADFVDIREDSGATCSIYSEYLAEGIVPLDRENPNCSKLCSALLYGIRSDTDDYLLARELDYRAAAFLAPYADHELLMAISLQNISPREIDPKMASTIA